LIFSSILTEHMLLMLIRGASAEEDYAALEELEFYLMREECEINSDYTLLLWILDYTSVRAEQSVVLAKIGYYD